MIFLFFSNLENLVPKRDLHPYPKKRRKALQALITLAFSAKKGNQFPLPESQQQGRHCVLPAVVQGKTAQASASWHVPVCGVLFLPNIRQVWIVKSIQYGGSDRLPLLYL